MNRTLYDMLEVAATASAETIRAAYLRLIKRCHPDKVGPIGLRLTQDINAAFDVLSDPVRRAAYDARLRRQSEAAAARTSRAGARPAANPSGSVSGRQFFPAMAAALTGHVAEAILFNFLYLGRGVIWLVTPTSAYEALSDILALCLAGALGYLLWPLMLATIRQCWPASTDRAMLGEPRLVIAAASLIALLRVMASPAELAMICAQLAFLGGLYHACRAGKAAGASFAEGNR